VDHRQEEETVAITAIAVSAVENIPAPRARSRAVIWGTMSMNMLRFSLLVLIFAFNLPSCAPDGGTIGAAQYAAKIVGDWQGTVGDMKETMSFNADGKFVSQVRPRGFISNTLSQGVTGTIRGTWTITGKVITMKITEAENERLQNKTTSSTIVTLRQNELVVTSMNGETSTFMRAV
jgi:hypothetical protein